MIVHHLTTFAWFAVIGLYIVGSIATGLRIRWIERQAPGEPCPYWGFVAALVIWPGMGFLWKKFP